MIKYCLLFRRFKNHLINKVKYRRLDSIFISNKLFYEWITYFTKRH